METKDLRVYTLKLSKTKQKHKKVNLFLIFFFLFLAMIPLANNWPFVLCKEECEHKRDGNIFFF